MDLSKLEAAGLDLSRLPARLPRRFLPPTAELRSKTAMLRERAERTDSPREALDLLRQAEATATSADEGALLDQLAVLDAEHHAAALGRLQTFRDNLAGQLPELRAAAETASEPLRLLETEIARLTAEAADAEREARRLECTLLGIDPDAEQEHNPAGQLAAAMV